MPSDPTPAPPEGFETWLAYTTSAELSALRVRLERAEADARDYQHLQENLPEDWDGDEAPSGIILQGIRFLISERDEARADTARRVREAHHRALVEASRVARAMGSKSIAEAIGILADRARAAAPAPEETRHE